MDRRWLPSGKCYWLAGWRLRRLRRKRAPRGRGAYRQARPSRGRAEKEQKKAPPKRGFDQREARLATDRAGSHHLDLDAAIRLQAVDQLLLVANLALRGRIRALLDRVRRALTFRVDTVRFDALAHQVVL